MLDFFNDVSHRPAAIVVPEQEPLRAEVAAERAAPRRDDGESPEWTIPPQVQEVITRFAQPGQVGLQLGLLLFLLQAYLEEGWTWMHANSSLAVGLFFGSWVWLLILALMALALSAWVKWKPAAGALMFGVFFVAAGFGVAINGVQ